MSRTLKSTTLAAAIALALPFAATAANDAKTMPAQANKNYSDRAISKDLNADREALQQAILTGQSVDQIKNKLASMGYQITSVNDSDKDYVEYEVVKGNRSYEVQVDLDAAAKSKKVDIAPNLWRAASTKAALRGEKVAMATGKDSSDRAYMKGWNDEKDALQKALGTGHNAAAYKSKLTQMGYQITAVNDAEKDYLEYEIAKGKNSYEVQIDLDDKGMGKKVDVTSNLWEADRTDRKTDQAKAATK
ncbi:MAG: hypothetical protein ABI696_06600 [Rubrivivax sp.]